MCATEISSSERKQRAEVTRYGDSDESARDVDEMCEEDEDGESVTMRTREISAATINAVTRTRETRGAGESDSETKGELGCCSCLLQGYIYKNGNEHTQSRYTKEG